MNVLKGGPINTHSHQNLVFWLSITQVHSEDVISEDMSVGTARISPSCQAATEARYKTYPRIGQL